MTVFLYALGALAILIVLAAIAVGRIVEEMVQ